MSRLGMQLLLNASNLHVGGGVQVAVSVIHELTQTDEDLSDLTVWASSAVHANLVDLKLDPARFRLYRVVNSHGLHGLSTGLQRALNQFDGVLTLFGPLYAFRQPRISVVGFAQAWIIYPDNDIYPRMSWFRRISTRAKYALQALVFRRADFLLVELEHVRRGLIRAGIGREENIRVVHNCLASIYTRPDLWKPLTVHPADGGLKLGFVGRNYLHKNTAIFPEVRRILAREYGLVAAIYVTFTAEEWAACATDFRAEVINVGPLSMAQCPTFYAAMDGVLFPSLLECFSATPLEAMAMERPLFAADRPYIRDVCGEHVDYFDPLDANDVARSVASYFKGDVRKSGDLAVARAHAFTFSNANRRARQYLACLRDAANQDSQHE